jgi:hypothetical protein
LNTSWPSQSKRGAKLMPVGEEHIGVRECAEGAAPNGWVHRDDEGRVLNEGSRTGWAGRFITSRRTGPDSQPQRAEGEDDDKD